jgi:hypothetical protein
VRLFLGEREGTLSLLGESVEVVWHGVASFPRERTIKPPPLCTGCAAQVKQAAEMWPRHPSPEIALPIAILSAEA